MKSRLPVCLLILASLLLSQLTLAHHLVEHIRDLDTPEIHTHSIHPSHHAHPGHSAHSTRWAHSPSNFTIVADEADHADEICAICLMYTTIQGCANPSESFPVTPTVDTNHPPPPAFLRAKPRYASSSIRAPPTL